MTHKSQARTADANGKLQQADIFFSLDYKNGKEIIYKTGLIVLKY